MVKDSRVGDYFRLKKELEEKKSELSRLEYEYNSIINQEPYMQGRLKSRQHTLHKLRGEIKSLEKEINNMVKIKDCMDILKLSGFTYDSLGGKDSAIQVGPWVIYQEGGEISVHRGGRAWAQGFKSVQEAKAWIQKKERWIETGKDECPVFTKGSKDDDATEHGSTENYGKNKEIEKMDLEKDPVQANDADEQWITVKGTHIKIGEGESKGEAVKNFISSKKGSKSSSSKTGGEESSKKEESSSKPKASKKKDRSEIKEGNTLRNSEGKRIGKIEKVFKNIRGEEMVKAMKSSEAYIPSYVRKSDVDNMAWTNTQKATPQEKEEFKKDVSKLSDLQHRYALADLIVDDFMSRKIGGDDSRSVYAEKVLGEDGEKLSGEDKKLYDKIKEDYNKNGKSHIAWDLKYEFREAEDNLREKYMGLDLPIYTFGNVSWHEAKEKVSGKSTSKDSDPRVAEANAIINLCGGVM